jgi:hypothetical protein
MGAGAAIVTFASSCRDAAVLSFIGFGYGDTLSVIVEPGA